MLGGCQFRELLPVLRFTSAETVSKMLKWVIALACAAGVSSGLDWWQIGPVYQIYPASFADSNGDGIGDLNGIASHVDHFSNIGVEAVWMSPIFDSPMMDNGYDTSNYTAINPMFGTLADFQNLVKTLHNANIKIMLDLVPNHSSNESQWFQDSVNKVNGKEDWYVWMDPKGSNPDGSPMEPNNWRSLFGGSAWTYNDVRQQFYLHQFGAFQPDLNYNNTDVLNEMKNVIRYWLGFGVDGFRVDAVPFIAETNYTLNEPQITGCEPADAYSCLDHIYTMDQDLTYEVLDQFAAVLQEQNSNYSSSVKVQFVEAYTTMNATMRYYSNHSSPFNFLMITSIDRNTNATQLQNLAQSYLKDLPEGAWPNWVIGNHDNPRIGTRMGSDLIDAMNMLVLLLPGTPVTYNGEEIGMTDTYIRPDQYRDTTIPNRDPERTPMQWNISLNAGFSTNATDIYLPVNPNFWEVNVAVETSSEPSHLSIYKQLVALNKELADSTSNNLTSAALNDWVFAFMRDKYLVVVNLNNQVETFPLSALNFSIGNSVTVKIMSLNSLNFEQSNSVSTTSNITLYPRSGVVFTTTSSTAAVTSAISLLVASVLVSFVGL